MILAVLDEGTLWHSASMRFLMSFSMYHWHK